MMAWTDQKSEIINEWIKTKVREKKERKEREQPMEIQWIMETSLWVMSWS